MTDVNEGVLERELPEGAAGRHQCGSCEGWAKELVDGYCFNCLAPPLRLGKPRYAVYVPGYQSDSGKWVGASVYQFETRPAAEKTARMFGVRVEELKS